MIHWDVGIRSVALIHSVPFLVFWFFGPENMILYNRLWCQWIIKPNDLIQ